MLVRMIRRQKPTATTMTRPDWRAEFRDGLDEKLADKWDNLSKRMTTKADLAKKLVNQEQAISKRMPVPSPRRLAGRDGRDLE